MPFSQLSAPCSHAVQSAQLILHRYLDPQLEAQIHSLSVEQLEDLGEMLLDFATEADLVSWLNRLP